MCQLLLVVEAAEKSGALITADFAMNENRDVYAVPGSIFSVSSNGTNKLIQQGARLFLTPNDLLEDLGLSHSKVTPRASDGQMRGMDTLLNYIPYDNSVSAEELIYLSRLDSATMQTTLLQLELCGLIEADSANRYTRITKEWKNG